MICSAVFLQASCILKLVLLMFMNLVYITLMEFSHVALFDNRDLLLMSYAGWAHFCVLS